MIPLKDRPGAEVWLLQRPVADEPIETLLMRKRHGIYAAFWQPATGGQEPGEPIMETALREAWEETGVCLSADQLQVLRDGQRVEMARSEWTWVGTVFFAWLTPEQSAEVRISDEHDGHGWFTFDQAARILKWPMNLENLERLMRRV